MIDPDIVTSLKMIAGDVDEPRVKAVRAKHDKQLQQRIETHLELLTDEVEKLIPRSHPLFESVLLLTLLNKVQRSQQTTEFKSDLDFPSHW